MLWEAKADSKTAPARTFFYETGFRSRSDPRRSPDSSLGADPVARLRDKFLSSSSTTYGYQLSSGAHNFCSEGRWLSDDHDRHRSFRTSGGQHRFECVLHCRELAANTYNISVWHDPAKVPGKARIIFVQLPAPHVKTITLTDAPRAVTGLSSRILRNPTGAGRAGRLHALPQHNMAPSNAGIGRDVIGMPLAADWTSTELTTLALIRLDVPKLYFNDIPLTFFLFSRQTQFNPVLFGNSEVSDPDPIPNMIDQTAIDDRADGTVRVGVINLTLNLSNQSVFFTLSTMGICRQQRRS